MFRSKTSLQSPVLGRAQWTSLHRCCKPAIQTKLFRKEIVSYNLLCFINHKKAPPLFTNLKQEINLKTLNAAYTSNNFESVKPPMRMLVMPATTVALVLLPTPSAPLWVKNPKKQA